MTTENQTLAELPLWLMALVALAGLSGEMLRADHPSRTGADILRRIALRSGAATMVGFGSWFGCLAMGWSASAAVAVAILSALAGADLGVAIYTRWIMRRVEACESGGSR